MSTEKGELVGITQAEIEKIGASLPHNDGLKAVALAAQRAMAEELGLTACDEGCNHLVSHCYSKQEMDEVCAKLGVKAE